MMTTLMPAADGTRKALRVVGVDALVVAGVAMTPHSTRLYLETTFHLRLLVFRKKLRQSMVLTEVQPYPH